MSHSGGACAAPDPGPSVNESVVGSVTRCGWEQCILSSYLHGDGVARPVVWGQDRYQVHERVVNDGHRADGGRASGALEVR